jgi:hypothetical protein
MRRLALVSLLTAPACFTEAPGLDEAQEGSSSESDSGGLEESEGGSSSSGEAPADPLDAYGPCQIDADCEIVPGDKGATSDTVHCYQRTCAIKCSPAGNEVCPGFFDLQVPGSPTYYPIGCVDDGYCSITRNPDMSDPSVCPDGMGPGYDDAVPQLICVWQG